MSLLKVETFRTLTPLLTSALRGTKLSLGSFSAYGTKTGPKERFSEILVDITPTKLLALTPTHAFVCCATHRSATGTPQPLECNKKISSNLHGV